jgi:Tfp pilus assembly protein PilO
MTALDTRAIALVALPGLVLLAALWVLAISPKRGEHAAVPVNIAAQEQRLQSAQTQVAAYAGAREQFPRTLAKLHRLDEAVPARAAISSLLRQLQRRAKARNSELRLVALKAEPQTATPDAPSDAAPAAPAAAVADGLAALPFTFEFTGKYFDLRDILATVRRSVRVRSGSVKVAGRLLTIDGLTFTRTDSKSTQTKAVVEATAYIASDEAASPQPPAAAAAATTAGGS